MDRRAMWWMGLMLAACFMVVPVATGRQTGPAAVRAASDIGGDWQGTLEMPAVNGPAVKQRVVLRVTKGPDGTWAGRSYLIDRGGQPFNVPEIAVDARAVKFAVPALDGTYEGTLSADGSTMMGRWGQRTLQLPLILVRATKETAWEIPAPPAPRKLLPADADPSFEVATIKPSKETTPGGGSNRVNGRNFVIRNMTMAQMIEFAWRVHPRQVMGEPEWLTTERYDITAVEDGDGEPSDPQWRRMAQKLLVERLHLTFHEEKRELSVYVLSVDKSGPKDMAKSLNPGLLGGYGFEPGTGGVKVVAHNASMEDFTAMVLQGVVLDRPVLDETRLEGRYDFNFTFLPDDSMFQGHAPPLPAGDAPAPSIFTAMWEQVGLKLEAVKKPAKVMVIDKVERPTAN